MPHRSGARWIGLIALVMAGAAGAADPSPLPPFQADYQVLRNGKELGRATLSLQQGANGTWEFSSQTRGTKGMASLVGLDIVEKSTFHWRDAMPEGLRYSYAQDAAIKSRQRSTEFDWTAHEARSSDGKGSWVAPLRGNAMDRNLVTVALMSALKSGSTDLTFPVVDKDRVAEQRYVVGGREPLSVPAGSIEAVRVDRQRDDGRRTTTSWFAPQRGFLPVQIEQVEKNGETVTMKLAAVR